jgi:hypothetical protein
VVAFGLGDDDVEEDGVDVDAFLEGLLLRHRRQRQREQREKDGEAFHESAPSLVRNGIVAEAIPRVTGSFLAEW